MGSAMPNKHEMKAREMLAFAGITINGPAASDPQVHNTGLYGRVFAHKTLGFGEAYMDGDFDVADLALFFKKVFEARLHEHFRSVGVMWLWAKARLRDMQNISRARRNVGSHYDLDSRALFEPMLGKYMAYSCAIWSDGAISLNEAQAIKLNRNCELLRLQKGEQLLDVGCGWGDQLIWAHDNYGVRGVGVTLSEEQASYAKERCGNRAIEIYLMDYRNLAGKYDKVISTGMFEHVGPKHYREFMQKMRALLREDEGALFHLHTIGGIESRYEGDKWTDKYIFPGGVLPSAAQIFTAMDGIFVPIHMENIGPDYARTLKCWRENFESIKGRYDERFQRMWHFYLCFCEAGFEVKRHQVYRATLSPCGVPKRYPLTI
jgi:cyclopropane-fatty-acyl-phospholipid synthase